MSAQSITPIVAKPRMNAVAQYLMSLAAVIAIYSAYAQFAVPVIEGPPNLVKERFVAVEIDELPSPREEKSHLIPLLPADAWELTECKTLIIDAGTILFKEHEEREDGSLTVEPFTLIAGLENGPKRNASGQTTNTPTVLRCLSGANLKFNKPVRDLFRGKAKMESCRLTGRVDIYRPPSQPDQNDALHVVTSNVQIDKQRIHTLEQVQFAFGPNRGSGRNMLINLTHETESPALADFSTINGVRRLELAFLDKLRIEPTDKELNAMTNTSSPSGNANKLLSSTKSPLEVTCQGPFVFDFAKKMASFQDQVVAEQIDEFRDSIRCDELILMFEDKPKSGHPDDLALNQPIVLDELSRLKKNNTSLQLQRFVAKGTPAIVVSRSRSAKISAEFLSYDLASNQIEGRCDRATSEMVTVVSPEFQMVAKLLTYQIPDDDSLGEISVTGPGRMLRNGKPGKDDFFSTWKTSLTTRNVLDQPGMQQIIVDGAAEFRIADDTHINADRLELMVWQVPKITSDETGKSKTSWEYQPSRLFTTGNVTIVSPKLDGEANHLSATWPRPTGIPNASSGEIRRSGYRGTIWRQEDDGPIRTTPNATRQLARIPHRSQANGTQTATSRTSGFVEQTGPQQQPFRQDRNVRVVGFDADAKELQKPEKKPSRKLKFKGETVDVRLTGTGDQAEILDLTVVGNVSIVSQPIGPAGMELAASAEEPLTISGHRLQLTPQSGEANYRTLISGKNGGVATVTAKDFVLTGQNINLDQAANKVWVEGAGTMKLTTHPGEKKNSAPEPNLNNLILQTATPENLDVAWQGGMIFDGAKIYFENGVVLSAEQIANDGKKSIIQTMSEGLSVELTKPVQFQNLESNEKISDAEIRELVLVDQVPETKQRFKTIKHSDQSDSTTAKPSVVIDNRTYNQNGELVEQQRFKVPQAIMNADSGSVKSKGPGSISIHRVKKQSGEESSNPFGRLAGNRQSSNESGISFIQINFDGEMNVDADNHEMRLERNIRTVYSPVQNWNTFFNPDNMRQRAPGMVYLTCENLQLAQWTPRASDKKISEMIATGNSHIFSDTFEATSDRVSYDQESDTLTIVGTPRNDAKLLFKQSPNDKEPTQLVANKITYRIRDQATGTFGVKTLNINRK